MPEAQPSTWVLLDTHIWVWLMEGEQGSMSDSAVRTIQRASGEGRVRIAAISVWEVAMLESKGRVTLSRPIGDWVRGGLTAPGTHLVQFAPKIAIESTRLPGQIHADPADRILIATARVEGMALVTRDAKILEYAEGGRVAVVDATP